MANDADGLAAGVFAFGEEAAVFHLEVFDGADVYRAALDLHAVQAIALKADGLAAVDAHAELFEKGGFGLDEFVFVAA